MKRSGRGPEVNNFAATSQVLGHPPPRALGRVGGAGTHCSCDISVGTDWQVGGQGLYRPQHEVARWGGGEPAVPGVVGGHSPLIPRGSGQKPNYLSHHCN